MITQTRHPIFSLVLLVAFGLLAGCGRTAPSPQATPTFPADPLQAARTALADAPSYRWQSTFTIRTPNEPEGATVVLNGERSQANDAEQTHISETSDGPMQAGWVRIGSELWLFSAPDNSWTPLPAAAATNAIDRLKFLDIATVWEGLETPTTPPQRVGGSAPEPTHHITWQDETTPAFLRAEQITPTQPIQFDAWLDPLTALPLKTTMRLEGTNAEAEQASIELTIFLQDVGATLEIAPPSGAPTLPGPGTPRITESLADNTALPLAPDAAETLPEAIPDNIQSLIQTFSVLGNEARIAIQLYATPQTVEALESHFTNALPSEGWTIDQRVPGQYTDNALTLLVSRENRNGQIIMLPLEGGTLIISTLQ